MSTILFRISVWNHSLCSACSFCQHPSAENALIEPPQLFSIFPLSSPFSR